MARFLLVLILLLAPLRVAAQAWELRTGDDGSFFLGSIAIPDVTGFELLCGGRSAQGLSPEETGNMEPETTAPGSFRMVLAEGLIGPAASSDERRGDVIVVTGATGFRLRDIRHNELLGAWEAELSDTDPVFGAISGSPRIELRSRAGTRVFPAAGFDSAIKRLGDYCRSMFAAIGQPWNGDLFAGQGTRGAAEAAVAAGCNGAATREPGYLLTGDIDGDGAEDALLDWSRIWCETGAPRPFCGASLCTTDVILSARSGLPPESLLTRSIQLIPLSNGQLGIATVGLDMACRESGSEICESLFYWDGTALSRLD